VRSTQNPRAWWAARAVGLCLTAWCGGCASDEPPATFSIDPVFSAEEAAVIRDAIDAWCDAVDYCPTEEPFRGKQPGAIVADAGEIQGTNCAENMRSEGQWIHVDPYCRAFDLDMFWTVIAHEIGHHCADHTTQGLMASWHSEPEPDVDTQSRMAWHAGCQ
jgi:hypothetical protein